jgi:hypothetical protein
MVRPSSALRVRQQLEHRDLMGEIEVGRGLVEQQQVGLLGERHRDPRPLALAAGELVHGPVGDRDAVGRVERGGDGLHVPRPRRRSRPSCPPCGCGAARRAARSPSARAGRTSRSRTRRCPTARQAQPTQSAWWSAGADRVGGVRHRDAPGPCSSSIGVGRSARSGASAPSWCAPARSESAAAPHPTAPGDRTSGPDISLAHNQNPFSRSVSRTASPRVRPRRTADRGLHPHSENGRPEGARSRTGLSVSAAR